MLTERLTSIWLKKSNNNHAIKTNKNINERGKKEEKKRPVIVDQKLLGFHPTVDLIESSKSVKVNNINFVDWKNWGKIDNVYIELSVFTPVCFERITQRE